MQTFKKLFLLIYVVLFISCDLCPNKSRGSIFKWQTAIPENHGLDSEQLERAFTKAQNVSSIYSLLIIKDGHIVGERYYRGHDANSSFNIRSVSKSFLSALIGIAIENDIINSVDDKVLDYFPEYVHDNLDKRKNEITIRHLLTMQAGIDRDRNNYSQIFNTDNWIKSTIEEKLIYALGERWVYNTFLTHLLSGIITKAAEISTYDFAKEYLFNPLGIEIQDWKQSPQGIYFGGNNMFLTTRDMAILGLLYLNNGEMNDVQIVPYEWVEQSLQNTMPDFQKGWTWGKLENGGYGYLWWLGEIRGYKTFTALGHGGQFVMCFPDIDMLVVTNSDAYVDWDTADENERIVLDLIADHIIPALK